MNTLRLRSIATFTLATLLAGGSAFAQGTIRNREVRQQDRIANGVRSGQLTPRETAHLERREARINHQVRVDRRRDGGRLNVAQRRRIHREQNRTSRAIYRDKHNRRRA
ncbi:hypothetical protein ACFPT7_18745 [Acidicapsa dinghuensis]|uniref:DUF4148 domain-containing protein n=1 Tax=Acidicapsa dinghuensis TaxID=2218256 RepID=A0ABW1EJ93_9BACT|nr:hypothetical protein [Acidicapsa dinghuensis]